MDILDSLSINCFSILFVLSGMSVLSCKPNFFKRDLQKKVATPVLVGKTNVGKTGLGEIGVTPAGTDNLYGKAHSYLHISEHEYGKRTKMIYAPITISDPDDKYAKQYGELFQHTYDGVRRTTSALDYTPGLGPLTCINYEFLELLRNDPSWYVRNNFTSTL